MELTCKLSGALYSNSTLLLVLNMERSYQFVSILEINCKCNLSSVEGLFEEMCLYSLLKIKQLLD